MFSPLAFIIKIITSKHFRGKAL